MTFPDTRAEPIQQSASIRHFQKKEIQIIQLQYRGNSYESHPQEIETRDTGITAKYRGQTYQVRRPLATTCSQPPVNLKYRGVAYAIDRVPAIKSRSQPAILLMHT